MMTNDEYVKHEGLSCPSCGGPDVTACGYAQMGTDKIRSSARCPDCGSSWTDIYVLVGFENLELGAN